MATREGCNTTSKGDVGKAFFAPRSVEWWTRAKNEMRYVVSSEEGDIDWWEEDSESELAEVPPKPLSFLWIKERREMLRFDAKLPSLLPSPSMHQIRKGLSRFPPPRQSHNVCSGVKKLSVLLENQVSTWVSVTAKGEDIAKYVDLRGPVPGIAGLQPICPTIDLREVSPILGMHHLPAFALSDQFLFYKPEKALTDALKSLGNERDSIEHVAARLHTALLANGMDGEPVNWLLCVLSSFYWRVVGDAHRAVGCLQCALQTAPPHTRDVALIGLTVVVGTIGLLFPKVPLLIWLPSLLLLCSSCVSLSALIYLNKGIALRSRDNLLFYVLLTVALIVFRVFCVCLLLIGIFVPHAVVWISGSLATEHGCL